MPQFDDTGKEIVRLTAADIASIAAGATTQLPSSLGPKTGANSLSVVPNTDTPFQVVGTVANDAVDGGNSIKTGGKAVSVAGATAGAVAAGDRADSVFTLWGAPYVVNTFKASTTDGSLDGLTALAIVSDGSLTCRPLNRNEMFNGTTWDRQRSNVDTAALITATGATTTQTSADQTNYNGRGVQVVLDMTSAGTGSVTITIQGKDAASGKYYTLLAGAAVVANSTNLYTVYPGAAATANVSSNSPLPRIWRVIVTANNANATTYTVGASVIL